MTDRDDITPPGAAALFSQNRSDLIGGPRDPFDPDERLKRARAVLRKSATGRALLDFADRAGIKIYFDRTLRDYGLCHGDGAGVALAPRMNDALMVAVMAHELRHAWQGAHDYWPSAHMVPEDSAIMTRMMEADAEATAVQVCVELRQQGVTSVFNAFIDEDNADIADAYLRAANGDPMAVQSGRALRAAFDEWFEDRGRREGYEKETIDLYQSEVDRQASWSEPDRVTLKPDHFRGLGEQPGGGNYLAATGGIDHRQSRYGGRLALKTREAFDRLRAELRIPPAPPAAPGAQKRLGRRRPQPRLRPAA